MSFLGKFFGNKKGSKTSLYEKADPVVVNPQLYDPLSGTVAFNDLHYFGRDRSENVYLKSTKANCSGKGAELVNNAVDKLVTSRTAIASSTSPQRKLNLLVSDKGVRLEDPKTSVIVEDATYTSVPYCGVHPVFNRIFSFICEDCDAETPSLSVHVLGAVNEAGAQLMTKTVTEACSHAYRSRMTKNSQNKKVSSAEVRAGPRTDGTRQMRWKEDVERRSSLLHISPTPTKSPMNAAAEAVRANGDVKEDEEEKNGDDNDGDEFDAAFKAFARSRSLPEVRMRNLVYSRDTAPKLSPPPES